MQTAFHFCASVSGAYENPSWQLCIVLSSVLYDTIDWFVQLAFFKYTAQNYT